MKRAKKKSKRVITKKVSKPGKSATGKAGDIKSLVHSLQVNLIELEHQNHELRIAEAELEASRDNYVTLFDFSPVPYFAVDPAGIITEVNLSAGRMFGVDRSKLVGKNIDSYVPPGEKHAFNAFLKNVFDSGEKQSSKCDMIDKDKRVFHVLLEGLKRDDTLESGQRCQIAITDLTEFRKLEDSVKKLSEELALLKSARG